MSRHVDYTPEQKAAQLKSARGIALRARARGHDPYAVSNDFWLIALDDEIERLTQVAENLVLLGNAKSAECERLRAALKKYGRHHEGCNDWADKEAMFPDIKCDCGWKKARKALARDAP